MNVTENKDARLAQRWGNTTGPSGTLKRLRRTKGDLLHNSDFARRQRWTMETKHGPTTTKFIVYADPRNHRGDRCHRGIQQSMSLVLCLLAASPGERILCPSHGHPPGPIHVHRPAHSPQSALSPSLVVQSVSLPADCAIQDA